MAAGIFAGPLVGKLVHYAIAGTAGNLIVKGAARARPHVAPVARRAAVRAIAGGIVGGRKLGDVAEEARLQAGDLLAEARSDLGEAAPAPAETSAPAPKPAPPGAKRVATKSTPAARKAAPRRKSGSNAAAEHRHEH